MNGRSQTVWAGLCYPIFGLLALIAAPAVGQTAPETTAAKATAPVSTVGALNTLAIGPCKLLLPKIVYAAPGREANLYFDNVTLTPPGRPYLFNVDCGVGIQQQERWTWTPTEKDAGDYALTLEVRDLDDQVVATGKTIVRVSPADTGTGKPFSLLAIGDSLTGPGIYTGEVLKLYRAEGNTQFKLLGTVKRTEPEGNAHQGYGGWRYRDFVTKYVKDSEPGRGNLSTSPFIFVENDKPVFDFPRYLRERLDGAIPDAVSIFLGCNDNFGAKDDTIEASIDTMFTYADQLLAGIRAGAPNAKIAIITTVPPTASQDSFGNNYKNGQTRWQYRKNQHRVVDRLLQKFEGREAEGIYIVPAYINLDTVNGFAADEVPANARTERKVWRQNNGVHPNVSGYLQIADSLYDWLKNVNK